MDPEYDYPRELIQSTNPSASDENIEHSRELASILAGPNFTHDAPDWAPKWHAPGWPTIVLQANATAAWVNPNTPQINAFKPVVVEDFPAKANLPPGITTPHDIFMQFFDREMVRRIAKWTNIRVQRRLDNTTGRERPNVRGDHWETTMAEIYVFLACLIYMGNFETKSFTEYFDQDELTPNHPISKWLSLHRFRFLYRWLTVFDPDKVTHHLHVSLLWTDNLHRRSLTTRTCGLNSTFS